MAHENADQRLTPYQRRLFLLLGVATFFEGYDMIALTQLLPNLRADFEISFAQGATMVGFINVGTIVAFLLIRRADRWGRKPVLMITIGGYTIFTLLSGLAPHALAFALAQFMARIFLIGEWAISMVYAAEEFPAARRGMVLGVLQGFSSLGAVTCAGLVPLLLTTPFGWRSIYFIGAVPLVLLMVARRGLRETRRFETQGQDQEQRQGLMAMWTSPYRNRMLQLAAIWFLTYLCTQNAITFWKEFAIAERGLTDGEVGASITIAALASMPLVFAAGKLLDVIGRRRGAVVIYLTTALGCVSAYGFTSHTLLTMSLVLAIFGVSAVLPVLNSYNAEMFPTELRGDAFSWSNNLLGRIGYVLSPLLIGKAAGLWGIGPTVSATAIFPILALGLILFWLPETRGRELEDTSAL